MNRRDFVRSAGAVTASLAFPGATRLAEADARRTFKVNTRVEILEPSAPVRYPRRAGGIPLREGDLPR